MAMPKCPKERRIRSWPQQLAPPVVLRSLGFWCSATTAATSSMGRTLATACFSFLSTNAQGDAATDQRHTALTRGTHRPHSTHKVSAIRPETSSKKTMERQGDRAGGHGWPSKPLHPATCCLGTAATGCAPRRTRRRRLLSRTWPGLQGGCIAKTLSTADLRLATPPLQKSMGDFLQARIDRGDIWEAGGRLRCRRRLGMHVYHLCLQLLLLAQVCRLRSLVKLRIGDANHTVTSDHRVLSPRGSSTQHATAGSWQKTKEGQANAAL